MIEKNFPRGGKKPIISLNSLSVNSGKINKAKSRGLDPKKYVALENESLTFKSVQNLKLINLQEGMKVLGCVFKVYEYYAIISLPGQISAKLLATDISESYTNLLEKAANDKDINNEFKTLSSLYVEGEYIVCYIKKCDLNSKKIFVSLEPRLVNENVNWACITNNCKLAVTVGSVEDHGYVLETGINNIRAFLSFNDVDKKDNNLVIGRQIICAVRDIKFSENIYIITVSIKYTYLANVENNIPSVDNMIPGAKYSLVVKNILKHGLQVSFGKSNIGFINHLYTKNLSLYKQGQELTGILLYIIPVVKFAYFSLLHGEQENKNLMIGDLINNAKVLSLDSGGILMKLKKNMRGYVPLNRTEVNFEKIKNIFSINSTHLCKIIAYDMIAKIFICTMEKKILEEKYICSENLKVGSIVELFVDKIDLTGFITVKIGKIIGSVSPEEVMDPGTVNNLKLNQTVQGRVLCCLPDRIWFTLKKLLVESKLPILSTIDDAKVNSVHDGTVIKIKDEGVLVRFFNNIKGWIPKKFLDPNKELITKDIVHGQTITTVIKKIHPEVNKIVLAPVKNTKNFDYSNWSIGNSVEGVVIDSSIHGVHVLLKNNNDKIAAFLPAGHISPCIEVGKILSAKAVAGDKVTAVIFSKNPSFVLTSIFSPEKEYILKDLKNGDLIICSVDKILKDSVKVLLPIKNYFQFGEIKKSQIDNFDTLYINQIFFGKITKIDKKTGDIELTAQFSKVWKNIKEKEVKMMTAVDILSCYLNKLNELSKNIYYSNKKISAMDLGKKIKATVECVMDSGLLIKLDKGVKGIVRTGHMNKNYKQGDQIRGLILWVNHHQEYVEITLLPKFINCINRNQNSLKKIPIGIQLRGEIVLATEWFLLAVLKGQGMGTLVALPVRRHLNDTQIDLTSFRIGSKIRCYGVLNKDEIETQVPICLLKSAFETLPSKIKIPDSSSRLKRKLIELDLIEKSNKKKLKTLNDNYQDCCQKLNNKNKNDMKILSSAQNVKIISDAVKSKKRETIEILNNSASFGVKFKEPNQEISEESEIINKVIKISNKEGKRNLNLYIPEIGFKWNNVDEQQSSIDSSSDREDIIETTAKSKKKKITSVEIREREQEKEREICKQEEALFEVQVPQTADQFDRLVFSSPDNSLIWIQYMSHYLQSVNIDMARAVARRALKTINFKEEDEKLNVWQAWLNLEAKFGSPESLKNVYQDALKVNDAEKIYTHMLKVYTDACKPSEIQKIISIMTAKFKFNIDTWIKCAIAYYNIGLKENSRHLLERALKVLPEFKHIELIVKFSQLENKFGDIERSQTLYEKILTSYPKRVDVWSSYVDSLVKSGQIDIARKVLERAVTLNLPTKKMKTLFKKYLSFEEKHGTNVNVSRVKDLAINYVKKHTGKV